MTARIERRGRFPGPRDEAKLVGPYPTWDLWKRQVFERFPNLAEDGSEPLLGEYYTARRLVQKTYLKTGNIDTTPVSEFLKRVNKEDPFFLEKCRDAIAFILDNTKIKSSQEKH